MIDVTESFNLYGTVVFATKVMSSAIATEGKELEIEPWLEIVPAEFQSDIGDIIISMKPGLLVGKTIEEVKTTFIEEIQRRMKLKIKSGKKLKSSLPDFG
jgi:hypothetical protein